MSISYGVECGLQSAMPNIDYTDLSDFYNKLSSLVCSIPKHNVLIISRDMNAQIGKNVSKQIQPIQLVKQKWETSNRFHARK